MLGRRLLRCDLEIACGNCSYPVWVQWSEAVVQTTVRCPCCRVRIQLVDQHGTMANTVQAADQALERLEKALKGIFG